jgi:hypothetical protein
VALLPETTLWEAGVAVTVKSAADARAAPVPVRELVCVPTASVTVSAAVKVPAEVGAKVTAMVQEAPAASVVPQVSAPSLKEEAFAPVMPTEEIDSAALPALASVKVWAALLLPVVTLLKFAEAAVSAACGAVVTEATPVPVSAAVCVPT